MLTTEQVKFVIGVLLAVLVTFSLWWFFIHNEADRRAEESAVNFVNAVDMACQDSGQTKPAKIEMPQELQLADFWKQLTPGGVGNEPYYYLFWERFPPEAPYNIGDITSGNIMGTAASIIAPWSEDLPWNSNLLMTMTVDMVGLGVNVLGTQVAGEYLGDIGTKIKNTFLGDIAEKIQDSETFTQISAAIAKGKDWVGMPKGYIQGGKWVIREGLTLSAETSMYTVFCMYTFHESLGKCATYSLVAAFATDFVAKPLITKFALPAIKDAIKTAATKIIDRVGGGKGYSYTMSISDQSLSYGGNSPTLYGSLDSYYTTSIDSTSQNFLVSNNDKGFISSWNVDPNNGDIIDGWMQTDTPTYEATVEYFGENGNPQKLDFFEAQYENGEPTGIRFKYKEWKESMKAKLLNPIKNFLVEGEGKVFGHHVYTPEGGEIFSEELSNWYTDPNVNPDFDKDAKQLMDAWDPKKSYTREEAVEKLSNSIEKLNGDFKNGAMAIGSIDSDLDKVMGLCESDPEGCRGHIRDYLTDIHSPAFPDKNELRRLGTIAYERDYLRIGEDLKKLPSRGVLGYSLLRIQDLYTPLGATYWDKQMDYSNYGGKRCEDGEICLQMGFFVRKYPLPQSCIDEGVKYIKLDRGSLVAANPRFYLVSPCYAYVDVRKDGDTVWIKPLMCPDKDRNYCFATSGLVDWYVGIETAAYIANCVATGLCEAAELIGSAGILAPKSILGILKGCVGIGVSDECALIGSAIRTTFDFYREAFLKYPDVYSLTKTQFGDLRGDYLWSGNC
ncbi:MAG: hypothetical protein NTW30_01575 [Candidatus Aenigmarchaeota archaeon]|nr:hypothetical protein [Candidatus Aenigmarchaeota archaeon]